MRFAIPVITALVALVPAAASARPIGFNDLRSIVSVNDPQISPDGKRVAFLRGRADYTADRTNTQLVLLDVRSGRSRDLTYGRRGISMPAWSADGSRIAFLATAPGPTAKGGAQEQLFVMPMSGGDARQLTATPEGVDGYAWSPDGTRIAYVSPDPNPRKKQIEDHLDAFEIGDNDYLHTATALPSHLWLVASNGGASRRLTSGSWSLGTVDPYGTSPLSWSADGRTIAFVRYPTPLVGDSLGTVVDIVDARTGKRTALTGNPGLEGDPDFAPAGETIAYSRNTGGDATNGNAVYVTRPGGGAGTDVRARIDRSIDAALWSNDGKALWFFGEDGTHGALWYAALHGAAKRVDLGSVQTARPGNIARKTGALVFVGSTNERPGELYLLASPGARPRRLTDENAFLSRVRLGRVTSLRWHNDRFSEDGVLTLPPGYASMKSEHKSVPLVLLIHGGPQAASTEGWSSQRQLFASHGYLVFEPNYRGSTNLGDAYQHAISRDAGDGPGRDVMAGVATVERLYPVDRNRIAVSGWSYGGYMTSWMTGHYHIWKAAVAGAALNDWFDDYNIAFYVHTDEPYFGGSPWDPKFTAMWREQSPITYAQNIRTPTLIMGDIGDNNVVITNSFKMYHALKDNGVTVRFVAYPVHGHHPSDPVRSEDVTRRWLSWLDTYLQKGSIR